MLKENCQHELGCLAESDCLQCLKIPVALLATLRTPSMYIVQSHQFATLAHKLRSQPPTFWIEPGTASPQISLRYRLSNNSDPPLKLDPVPFCDRCHKSG
eukprot:TRINITY_DN35193_c0_g1_i1.p1 TRINITY_DN35193_c0_g1~~TRINITY_DN35193_c0_g1_i1.p1  ORF type:complete len:100 (-),score=1.17 TRINITY_DN35193_c0_g1_i1:63-362(-)